MAEVPKFLKESGEPLKRGALVVGTLAFLANYIGIAAISALGYWIGWQLSEQKK
jgi:hypothetical protein